MAYIHLHQIAELAKEASLLKNIAISQCYNSEAKKHRIDDAQFVYAIKTNAQAQNLLKNLRKLHQLCTDFATGNFQPYIDKYTQCAEDETEVFDPFEELDFCFNVSSVYDLPVRIERYSELLVFSQNFAEIQKVKREGRKQFWGNIPRYYETTDSEGQLVMVPEHEVPEDIRLKRDANQEIADIELEYCLDRYNEFYVHATGLLSAFSDGDIQGCAEAILSLFNHSK